MQPRPQQTARHTLVEHGFRPVYETAAVVMLRHNEHPGVLVRLGVTRIVVEREDQEIFRAPLSDFNLTTLLTRLAQLE